MDACTTAGETVLELARKKNGHTTQADIRLRISEKMGVEISHQKFSQWITGESSFPNDFAEIFTRAYDLDAAEQVEIALALSYGQRTRRLLGQTEP